MVLKNTRLQYHTERPGSPSDNLIFTVAYVGRFKTTLKPEHESEFNPRFQIDNADLERAINAGYYTKLI